MPGVIGHCGGEGWTGGGSVIPGVIGHCGGQLEGGSVILGTGRSSVIPEVIGYRGAGGG